MIIGFFSFQLSSLLQAFNDDLYNENNTDTDVDTITTNNASNSNK